MQPWNYFFKTGRNRHWNRQGGKVVGNSSRGGEKQVDSTTLLTGVHRISNEDYCRGFPLCRLSTSDTPHLVVWYDGSLWGKSWIMEIFAMQPDPATQTVQYKTMHDIWNTKFESCTFVAHQGWLFFCHLLAEMKFRLSNGSRLLLGDADPSMWKRWQGWVLSPKQSQEESPVIIQMANHHSCTSCMLPVVLFYFPKW